MGEVASANGVPLVDLFTPTKALFAKSGPLTINGVHLNEAGSKQWPRSSPKPVRRGRERDAKLVKLRDAVCQDKSFHWYRRYRTTDGYSTYGDRAFLAFSTARRITSCCSAS